MSTFLSERSVPGTREVDLASRVPAVCFAPPVHLMSQHNLELLFENPACNIHRCDCGILHVAIGPVTLRLDPRALEMLHEAIGHVLHNTRKPNETEEIPCLPN